MDIKIVEVYGCYSPINFIIKTRAVKILKELFPYKGYGAGATIITDYLLNYYRDKNDINKLRV